MSRLTRAILITASALAAVAVGVGVARRGSRRPLHVVERLDLQRYVGRWYEIARMPTRFERGCSQGIATYRALEDGTLEVVNACLRTGGHVDHVRGVAWLPDASEPARLKVQFRWPFRGDYQVLHVDDHYEHAVVGEPSRRHAWILSRRATMSDDTYARLVRVLEHEGFDVGRLVRVAPDRATAPLHYELDPVDEAGFQSFPASDPPSFTPGHT